MITYLLGVGIIFGAMLSYIRLARRFHIIDIPDSRSSHVHPTISGGGVVFPIAVLYWFFVSGFDKPLVVAGLIVVSIISFIDDVSRVSYRVRLAVHVAVVTLLFWQADLFGEFWYIWATAYIFTIGWINAFNFMDGINGISGGYSLVSLLTFLYLNR